MSMLINLTQRTILVVSLTMGIASQSWAGAKEDKPTRHTIRVSGSQTQAEASPRTLSLESNKTNLIVLSNTTSQDQTVSIDLVPNSILNIEQHGFIESAENHYVIGGKGEASLTIKAAKTIKLKVKVDRQ
jgi:hypothetical protein